MCAENLYLYTNYTSTNTCATNAYSKFGWPMDALSLFHILPRGSTCTIDTRLPVNLLRYNRRAKRGLHALADMPFSYTTSRCELVRHRGSSNSFTGGTQHTHPARGRDDDRDGQQHVVRVDQAHRDARVPRESRVHGVVRQDLAVDAVVGDARHAASTARVALKTRGMNILGTAIILLEAADAFNPSRLVFES